MASIPNVPTGESSFADTEAYLQHLRKTKARITVRELIGYWGYLGRGPSMIKAISDDLAAMKLAADPPFDVGSLNMTVTIQAAAVTSPRNDPADHLLTLARIRAASFALADREATFLPGVVEPQTSIDEATTMMLRYDYSQLLVVDDITKRGLVGVVSWKSYGAAKLRRENPQLVADIMQPVTGVDLHSDLFSNIGPVVRYDFVAVTYQGSLAGIVTATDLTEQFEDLAVPFLAVGRCERELKRVARLKFSNVDESTIEKAMLGKLQQLYRSNWEQLGWELGRDAFDDWVDATRNVRNKVAHFEDEDEDLKLDVRGVHRLTAWLRGIN